ncbi:hypothetical protein IWX90DRAFT_167220 [Phyllosticta citrichinensis]|uniref:Secreted protein n=1 Tax=Phyllosticta citrichinensis TaxID=1130410 RepID=A0ABR1Y0X4_9PEZI
MHIERGQSMSNQITLLILASLLLYSSAYLNQLVCSGLVWSGGLVWPLFQNSLSLSPSLPRAYCHSLLHTSSLLSLLFSPSQARFWGLLGIIVVLRSLNRPSTLHPSVSLA